METKTPQKMETIEPVGLRILFRKDDNKKVTKGGIELPDSVEIPVLTGYVVAVSQQVDRDDDYPIQEYDKVIINPEDAIPVELEHGNKLFVISAANVIAIIRKQN